MLRMVRIVTVHGSDVVLENKLASRPKFCPRPHPCPRRFGLGLGFEYLSSNFLFGPCEIVCNASIGNISEFVIVS